MMVQYCCGSGSTKSYFISFLYKIPLNFTFSRNVQLLFIECYFTTVKKIKTNQEQSCFKKLNYAEYKIINHVLKIYNDKINSNHSFIETI